MLASIVYPQLKVVVAPMFAGKTTRMLYELDRARDLHGGTVMLFVHDGDARPDLTAVTEEGLSASSHSRFSRLGATTIPTLRVSTLANQEIPADCVAIGVDEANFFDGDDLVAAVSKWLMPTPSAPRVIAVCGLDGTRFQEPFPNCGISRLLPMANEFEKMTSSICIRCVKEFGCEVPAAFTVMRNAKAPAPGEHNASASTPKSDQMAQEPGDSLSPVLVGGADKYETVCRMHLHCRG